MPADGGFEVIFFRGTCSGFVLGSGDQAPPPRLRTARPRSSGAADHTQMMQPDGLVK